MLHGEVKLGRKEEHHPDLFETSRDLLKRKRDGHTQRFQHIGASRAAGNRAVAVLGDAHAGGRRH